MSGKSQSKSALIKKGQRRRAQRKNLKETLQAQKLMKRMTKDHLDVLQNIEFVLVTQYREDSNIDDCIVADALKATIHGEAPEGARTTPLNEALEDIRQFRSDVSDDIWQAGLRTVLQSVHRHSDLQPGSTDYLDFVSDFIL